MEWNCEKESCYQLNANKIQKEGIQARNLIPDDPYSSKTFE